MDQKEPLDSRMDDPYYFKIEKFPIEKNSDFPNYSLFHNFPDSK